MKNLPRFDKQPRVATGTLNATIVSVLPDRPVRDFVATEFYFSLTDSYVGAAGYMGDEFIVVLVPRLFDQPSYPIALPDQGKGEVYIHSVQTGYAVSGEFTELLWDQQTQVFSGRFTCEGEDQELGSFKISDGQFSISYREKAA